MKILHSGDWHVRDADIEEIILCLAKITDMAHQQGPDLIVIAGDLFHSQDTKLDSPSAKLVVFTISKLAEVAPVAIVLGTPSHDGKAPEILELVTGKYPVRVASRPMQVVLKDDRRLFDIEYLNAMNSGKIEAIVSLIPQPTKQFLQTTDEGISEAMSGIFAGFGAKASEFDVPHILVGHWNVGGAELSTGQFMTGRDIEISRDQMALAKADLICLGHIHKAQEFYSGSIYRVNDGELEDKGFWIHHLINDADGFFVESEFIQTACKKLIRVNQDLTNPNEQSRTINADGAYVRIDMKVWQDEAAKINKEALEQFYMDAGALGVDIRLIRVPRETLRAESVRQAETLSDKIIEQAKIKGEEVPEGVLLLAEKLESMTAQDLIQEATL